MYSIFGKGEYDKLKRDCFLADFCIPHKNCSLIRLVNKFSGNDSECTIQFRLLPTYDSKDDWRQGIGISVSRKCPKGRKFFKDVVKYISRCRGIEIVSTEFDKDFFATDDGYLACLVDDEVFSIINKVSSGPNARLVINKYDIKAMAYQKKLRFCESIELIVLERETFLKELLPELRRISVGGNIDWRLYNAESRYAFPGVSWIDAHILDQTIRTDYFKSEDLDELIVLSQEVSMSLRQVEKRIAQNAHKIGSSYVNHYCKVRRERGMAPKFLMDLVYERNI